MRNRLLICVCFAAANPAAAQMRTAAVTSPLNDQEEQPTPPQRPTPIETNQAGRTSQTSAGQVGQRQTRDTAAVEAGIKPMARIANRIQNRVQNRLRNRIDQNYDVRANATDPFAVAEDQARSGGRSDRR